MRGVTNEDVEIQGDLHREAGLLGWLDNCAE